MKNCMFEGSLVNSKQNRAYLRDFSSLRAACDSRIVLEERALLFDSKKNLIFNLAGIRGIMPYEECAALFGTASLREISVISRVGKPVCFVITDFVQRDGETAALLSRREVQERFLSEYVDSLVAGDIVDAQITHVERFGCFADIGRGITSLLPIDSICISRITHPTQILRVGMQVRCVVKSRDEFGRLLLSHKELLGTWAENAALFGVGETVAGTVRSVESYGVFVELTPNLAGLAEPHEGAAVGRRACVYIKSILPARMKIKLIIIDCFDDAAQEVSMPKYFFDREHMDSFVYSPPGADKLIETVF
ncbi:MAG: S1 RNA-binding domain-containing protein [Oscillospiraceae bacterium]